ncbi:coiled-coil domain-containing protein 97 isoform X2 [Lepisosteus oculatus]|uniref:coiled-coil domain-containing protein 97 isoform X2 n=1 Tax=Lepisosteus oculatus TaxID=7918 RepID=UPI0035F51771
MISSLWGEIEPTASSSSSDKDEPACSATEDQNGTLETPSADTAGQSREIENEIPSVQDEGSSELSAMLWAVAESEAPVKSQQLGEPDLTMAQRRQVLLEQYRAKPLVFLERYRAYLQPEHLGPFAHLTTDCRAQHYCKEVRNRASSQANRTRVRNHRFAALRALQQEGQYFSEEQMRARDPLLYEQYIGQYLSDEELCQRVAAGQEQGAHSLAELLLHSYQEGLIQDRLQEQQDREEGATEEVEEEEDHVSGEQQWEPTPEEKALLREEFISRMHQRFLDGKDQDFNYSEVDENPDYDNLDIVSRDEEERYFDEDDPEEEDDMEME